MTGKGGARYSKGEVIKVRKEVKTLKGEGQLG